MDGRKEGWMGDSERERIDGGGGGGGSGREPVVVVGMKWKVPDRKMG